MISFSEEFFSKSNQEKKLNQHQEIISVRCLRDLERWCFEMQGQTQWQR